MLFCVISMFFGGIRYVIFMFFISVSMFFILGFCELLWGFFSVLNIKFFYMVWRVDELIILLDV